MMPEWPTIVLVVKEPERAQQIRTQLNEAGLRNMVLTVRCVNELSRLLRTRESRETPHPVGFVIIESHLWRANFSRLNKVRKEGRAPFLPLMVLFDSTVALERFEQARPFLAGGLLAPFTAQGLIRALERLHRQWLATGESDSCTSWRSAVAGWCTADHAASG
ncbi:hypothetical protein [Dyella jiangningensis]|uniref:Response regulatory domain-containing protein n=1 Tax=Dyella jiangningensis TaxID=1379159 RepID=A0A328P204_9GAMM|nr:hypothetical protein [Dyella jiangningensis]RAO76207.1 hypothetical protein CA260_10950 [Dyella jiangningensis]